MSSSYPTGHFLPIILFLIFFIVAGYLFTNHFQRERPYEIEGVHFDLLDPEMAPPKIKDQVMLGYNIFLDPLKYAPKYAGDKVSCNNCHFAGGNTFGGRNGGISLVGVTTVYPRYSKREGRDIDLAERINNCFERSLNGNPMPKDSQEMKALLAYLEWISKEVKDVKNIPWLGLKLLKNDHTPDPINGEKVYSLHCSECHGKKGGGAIRIPPLWGKNSFNDGAGMNKVPNLASFVFYNMPYQDSYLTEEEALDVASFISKQPRPQYVQKEFTK